VGERGQEKAVGEDEKVPRAYHVHLLLIGGSDDSNGVLRGVGREDEIDATIPTVE